MMESTIIILFKAIVVALYDKYMIKRIFKKSLLNMSVDLAHFGFSCLYPVLNILNFVI